ncbi:cupin domain-containing protein [Nitratireductor basaltis]|uniref:Cupin type-2 domain-containing protein n=1 Tax=Nitratireductor basaltis TaxID=472175 RepID=A0A084U540_9HYPH|nr:cupin domain-containing protein [Nitratireductor basaltis]KFB08076.1 hypothetical protein EL18_03286 [Nitratireductor basaltis]
MQTAVENGLKLPDESSAGAPAAGPRLLCCNIDLTLFSVRHAAGSQSESLIHDRPMTICVLSGRFGFDLYGETLIIAAGESLHIPGETEHSCKCIEEGELLHAFTSSRQPVPRIL